MNVHVFIQRFKKEEAGSSTILGMGVMLGALVLVPLLLLFGSGVSLWVKAQAGADAAALAGAGAYKEAWAMRVEGGCGESEPAVLNAYARAVGRIGQGVDAEAVARLYAEKNGVALDAYAVELGVDERGFPMAVVSVAAGVETPSLGWGRLSRVTAESKGVVFLERFDVAKRTCEDGGVMRSVQSIDFGVSSWAVQLTK